MKLSKLIDEAMQREAIRCTKKPRGFVPHYMRLMVESDACMKSPQKKKKATVSARNTLLAKGFINRRFGK